MTTGWFTFNQTIFISNSPQWQSIVAISFPESLYWFISDIHQTSSYFCQRMKRICRKDFFRSEQWLNIVDITFEIKSLEWKYFYIGRYFRGYKIGRSALYWIGNTSRKLTWTSINRFTQYIESWLYHYRWQIAPYHFLLPEKLAVHNIHSGWWPNIFLLFHFSQVLSRSYWDMW